MVAKYSGGKTFVAMSLAASVANGSNSQTASLCAGARYSGSLQKASERSSVRGQP